MAALQYDHHTTHAYSLAVLERFADVPIAQSFVADWLVADTQAQEAGLMSFWGLASLTWRRLLPMELAKSMQTWGVTWSNVVQLCEQLPNYIWTWSREDGGKHFMSRSNLLITTQMNILSKLPHTVQIAAAIDALVGAGWCCTLLLYTQLHNY